MPNPTPPAPTSAGSGSRVVDPCNFDFLKSDAQFSAFADTAVAAERVFSIDTATCAVNCRRAMEFAVKWMYSVDSCLVMPYQDKLVSLINTDEFKDLIGTDLFKRLDYIRLIGNNANHNPRNITKDQAALALENLYIFMDYIAYCYGSSYQETRFDIALAEGRTALPSPVPYDIPEVSLEQLYKANAPMAEELTARRETREDNYSASPSTFTEAQTRKAYIDVMLSSAGWERGVDWIDEYPVDEMPSKSGEGFADYVLLGDDGKPLAVIEAKKTGADISKGRQQAKLYADALEHRFGRRPVIFMTNGFQTRIWTDGEHGYPERVVSGIYSKRDLEKEFSKSAMRQNLSNIVIDDKISSRYYQKEAINAVCEAFGARNRRKALLVMATGSGKTRTVISLVDILMKRGWVRNFLFLADRSSLVIQAKRSFGNLLPDLSVTNLVEEKDNPKARGVFSTYQTIMNRIDDSTDDTGRKLYTPGHFDLIIIDEAHRSIYNKYRDIFTWFDSLLVGLTATPKDDIDKNTYDIFELEAGVPTYGYDIKQAVEDGYLVDYISLETSLKFMESGIVYSELSDEEKARYEDMFTDEDGEIPEKIGGGALNNWIFNRDTIRQVLDTLMTKGLKVEYGSKIGKTIIFAKSHLHAEKIVEVWNLEYPHYPAGFCRVIDNYTEYAQSLIDEFSDPNKMPQIAVSVDMLDTGIDVPEILNLVFFKKVMSKAKFWQMIGRGTRLCSGLIDGEDKGGFYIFDFCSNFEFFRVNNGRGKAAVTVVSLQQQLFNLKTELVYKLQDLSFQTDDLTAVRSGLVKELTDKVCELNRDNFAVRQHIREVDRFGIKESWQHLTFEDTLLIAEHVAPLAEPERDEFTAVRFDALIYGIELAFLIGSSSKRARNDLLKKVNALTGYGSIPEVSAQKEFIELLLNGEYIEQAGVNEFETIRLKLRGLMKYIEHDPIARYDTDFKDSIIKEAQNPSDLGGDELQNYKLKVSHYIRQNEGNPAIAKLKTNKPLSASDIAELERILWSEVGTKQDYRKEYGDMPLGELVRSITGLDMQAAKEAFSQFLGEFSLDHRQSWFVNQIINYIVQNGTLKDLSVLQSSPFTDKGSVSEIFTDMNVWINIRNAIENINSNAA